MSTLTLSRSTVRTLRCFSTSLSYRSSTLLASSVHPRSLRPYSQPAPLPRSVDHSRPRETSAAAEVVWSLEKEEEEGGGGRVLSFKDRKILLNGVELSPTHLRDHCRCSECFHPVTHQRLLDTYAIPKDIHPTRMVLKEGGLEVVWSTSHPSFYSTHLLKNLSPPTSPPPFISPSKILWTPSTSLTTFPNSLPASSLTSPSSILQALRTIDSQGVLFITGVDATTEATERVCRVLGKGKLRNTHYDEFWDFTADMKMGDLAYSNEPLRPHTDTTYFSSPCGLQIFHLLSHPSPPGTGGHTLLVDGFSCAAQLKEAHPASYRILRDTKRQAHAAGSEGFLYRTEKGWGVFEEGVGGGGRAGGGEGGMLEGVRWNGEDRSAFSGSAEEVERWYEALRDWEGILRKEENEKWVKLTGGVVCVIDNHRVMHGRSAFTGERRMCGAYIDRDEWRSHLAVLEKEERGLKGVGEEELDY